MTGWYLTLTRAPAGTTDAGRRCIAVKLNGVWQQGFPLTPAGLADALAWGPMNGKGRLPWRRDAS